MTFRKGGSRNDTLKNVRNKIGDSSLFTFGGDFLFDGDEPSSNGPAPREGEGARNDSKKTAKKGDSSLLTFGDDCSFDEHEPSIKGPAPREGEGARNDAKQNS